MDELTRTFVNESRDMLADMEAGLLRLEQAPDDRDNLNAIFRAAHTIKGGSGVIECHFIENFMHQVENLLDLLRNGEIPVTGQLATLLLSSSDHLVALLDILAAGRTAPDDDMRSRGEALSAELAAWLPEKEAAPEGGSVTLEPPADVLASGGGVVSTDGWHISVRFGADVLRNGTDPLSFLRYLASLGEILSIDTISDAIPPAAEMDAESCYLGFEIRFQTRASKTEIERVFEFVRDGCSLRILPPQSKVDEYIALINELPEDTMRLGEMLVRCGALTQAELDAGLSVQQARPDAPKPQKATVEQPARPIGEVLVEQQVVHREVVEAAASRQSSVNEKKAVDARMVRVQADKLDQLIDLVGELVIAGASANLLAQKSGRAELTETTSVLARLVENIRDAALQLRMVQIGETFSRFNRVVRDASREMGKDIDLVITGADTELDKSVVEKLGDPLMHLVRNAIDHGIESAALRLARGKAEKGRIGLNAYHDSGSIVIEVTDDGGGLSRERIRQKAIEKGLIDESATLGDDEIVNLIFEAGFSTADRVTNISGRGVGMDVVRRNIQALRGTVDVRTVEGEGSTFAIRLPLTLAIIDGFLTGVGTASYVVPLDSVVECIELQDINADRNFLNLRGEVLPFVRLRAMFDIPGTPPARQNVVVVHYAGRKAGLVVDALLGEFQTVIKPLGALFRHLRGIGGSTILGTGDVALILDVPALIQLVSGVEESRLHAPQHRELTLAC